MSIQKICPFCGMGIPALASKCPCCHSNLSKEDTPQGTIIGIIFSLVAAIGGGALMISVGYEDDPKSSLFVGIICFSIFYCCAFALSLFYIHLKKKKDWFKIGERLKGINSIRARSKKRQEIEVDIEKRYRRQRRHLWILFVLSLIIFTICITIWYNNIGPTKSDIFNDQLEKERMELMNNWGKSKLK